MPYTRCNGSTGTDLYLHPARFHAVFPADLPLSETEVMAAERRPFSASRFTGVTAAAAWPPSSRGASSPAPAWPSRLPSKAGVPAHAHCIEIPASHVVTMSHPGIVAPGHRQAETEG